MAKIEIQIRDGLSDFDFTFEGHEIASVSTEQPGRHQWVEMTLYRVEPGQAANPLLRLPDGGYVTHVLGQSVRAHRHKSSCASGLETPVADLIAEALPCPNCKPQFPLMRNLRPEHYKGDTEFELAVAREEQRVYAARKDLDGLVDLEAPRHSIRRSISPGDLIRHIIGDRLSAPAERLLREAGRADLVIKAALDDPAAALAIHEALVASGRGVLSS